MSRLFIQSADIVYERPGAYIAIGFFTPDYKPLADNFSRNLSSFEMPHHLYAVRQDEWQRAILMKPTIVLRALKDYPQRTIVLMDVDCKVCGTIDHEILEMSRADITLPARMKRGARRHGRVLFSSRVMFIQQTAAAKKLIERWEALCSSAKAPLFGRLCDERELVGAIGASRETTISFSSDIIAGLDIRNAPQGAKIVHVSEHSKRHDGIVTQIGKIGQRTIDGLRRKTLAK